MDPQKKHAGQVGSILVETNQHLKRGAKNTSNPAEGTLEMGGLSRWVAPPILVTFLHVPWFTQVGGQQHQGKYRKTKLTSEKVGNVGQRVALKSPCLALPVQVYVERTV